jgi:hypothetical protein
MFIFKPWYVPVYIYIYILSHSMYMYIYIHTTYIYICIITSQSYPDCSCFYIHCWSNPTGFFLVESDVPKITEGPIRRTRPRPDRKGNMDHRKNCNSSLIWNKAILGYLTVIVISVIYHQSINHDHIIYVIYDDICI